MLRSRIASVALGILSALAISASAAGQDVPARPIEAWADPHLKVTRGLVLWLDAGHLNAARKALGRPEAAEGARVDLWYDASGHGRHLAQTRVEVQPFYQDGALRFDGDASHLELAGIGGRFREITLFVVAAPLGNAGGFRAFMAINQEGKDDFTSGLNLDMGFGFSSRFETINVEGNGFGGMANLMASPSDFGVVRRMTVTSTPGPGGTKTYLDGRPGGSRDRKDSVLIADRVTVGARRYGADAVRGFLDGDILQVLVYDRVLDEAERTQVEGFLAARYGGKAPIVRPGRPAVGKPLVSVANPPAVQMLVPGFSARELPVDLSNINNIKYRPDGKLVALAYDGNLYLLSDSNGTGVEDRVERFWMNKGGINAPIGMALTPPGYPLGEGVFVASKGKISLITDVDRDGKADREIVVATGWKELPHGVDALGVAVDEAGAVYFGLGVTNFTNPYLVGASGEAAYDLKGEHGTIQKVAPDFGRREIIATGIRFPVGMAFNRHGDFFATDQEGATWLPNGNPFDELLHIRPGRHYGFPPRHPKYLPSVVDEPSVFDYAPQHQSTCGLNFNEPVSGGPTFGPAFWAGDALVTGYSRGKLYRTKLAKTEAGYVAQTHVFAVLNMLPVDACVSPRGDLVVAVHSGLPDWGSGPKGKGKLYKVTYNDHDAPQPVLAWASGPQEASVAFDRPLDLASLKDLARNLTLEYGKSVGPGDRYESLRPPYDAVARQLNAPRFGLPIYSAKVSADRRSLHLTTAPHPELGTYVINSPGLGRPDRAKIPAAAMPQDADVDLAYDLTGADVTWKPESGPGSWAGWLPHLDLAVSRNFTVGSAEHDRLWDVLGRPGRLTLKSRLDLWQMLRPAVQPGSTAGYTLPDEKVTMTFTGSGPIQVTTPAGSVPAEADKEGLYRVRVAVSPREREPLPLEVALETGGRATLEVSYTTAEDPRPRALPLRRLLLPWAALTKRADTFAERDIPELLGGNWSRGRAIFTGSEARCATCHRVRSLGDDIGPDLSNLIHRDYASVLRDIHAPSAAINPDYVAYSVALTDGRVLQGTLRTEADGLVVSDTAGVRTTVSRSSVDETAPSAVSMMPDGIDAALGPKKLRDLLTFLLTDPIGPAKIEYQGSPPPPPRRRHELDAVLKGSVPIANPRKLRIVLAGGPKDHGPGEHDYPLWLKRWSPLLATDESLTVETSAGWPSPQQLETADVVVFYSNNPGWDAAKAEQLDLFFARGGGVVLIHYAVDGHDASEALADRIGLAWKAGRSKFRHGQLEVDFSGSKHPITRGFGRLKLVDESYWNLVGDPSRIDLLGTGAEEGGPRPLFWARQTGKGRVFVSLPGHFTWTFDDPLFRVLMLRGMAWVAGEPVDRFNELATPGARIDE
ncbi:ThuA domain-containing protein [Isosphaeraceae bacterium EP7]